MVFVSEGSRDGSGREITFTGSYDDPMTGARKQSKTVYKIESDDKYLFREYDQGPDGKE